MSLAERKKYYETMHLQKVDLQLDAPHARQIAMLGKVHNSAYPVHIDSDEDDCLMKDDPDDQYYYTKYQRTANFNKEFYMKNFRINFTLPTSFIMAAKVYAKDPQYFFQLAKFRIPNK